MNETQLSTLAQLEAFVAGTAAVVFQPKEGEDERYRHISGVLRRFRYATLKRADKGTVLRYLQHTTGYSRQQLTRLVKRHLEAGGLSKRYRAPARGFARKFTDALHGTLSGPATRHLFERAATVHGDARFARLATLSVGHLYNLRRASGYVERRQQWRKTRAVTLPIGERRAPAPEGQPGFIRIDSVHQGDQDGVKGVYHINAVDCVTQWELVATCERISEAFMLPVIQALLDGFPFVIRGFHADNGSEYINHQVAKMLDKLRVEFTKSRPRHSNDNGLAETKNGAVVRKCLGYAHIPQRFATEVNAFCADFLNPYLNFHRPCLFAETLTDAKGKVRKRYPLRLVMTPFEKLKSIEGAGSCLKPGMTLENLENQANQDSDNAAAAKLNQARQRLFQSIFNRSRTAA